MQPLSTFWKLIGRSHLPTGWRNDDSECNETDRNVIINNKLNVNKCYARSVQLSHMVDSEDLFLKDNACNDFVCVCVCVCWEVERNQLTSKRLFLYRRRRKTWISHLGTDTENSQRSFNSIYSSDGKFFFDSVLSSPWVRDTITNCLFLLHHKFLAVKNEQNNSARWKRVTPPKGMKILRKQLLCNGISA